MNFPVELRIYETGKPVARFWVGLASESDWEHVERKAKRMANEHSAEIDILTGTVMPSGKVASFERAGMRVQPNA